MRNVSSFRGANEVSEPGIHNPGAVEYGFRAHRFAMSQNDRKNSDA